MMYQLGHRREWGLGWVPILFSFRKYVLSDRCKKFEGIKFHDGTFFLWRGKWSVRCHVMACTRNGNGSFVVQRDRHDWVIKGKVQGVRHVQGKRKTWSYQLTKATGDSKYQLGIIHAHQWLLLRSSGLLFNRDHDLLPFCLLKLFVCDEDFPT